MRLYQATLSGDRVTVHARIWDTTTGTWTWALLNTWEPATTPATPHDLADTLIAHNWTPTITPANTANPVQVTPSNWQTFVNNTLASRDELADHLRVAESILTNVLGDAADNGIPATHLATSVGLTRMGLYKRIRKVAESMKDNQAGETLLSSQLTTAEKKTLGLNEE